MASWPVQEDSGFDMKSVYFRYRWIEMSCDFGAKIEIRREAKEGR